MVTLPAATESSNKPFNIRLLRELQTRGTTQHPYDAVIGAIRVLREKSMPAGYKHAPAMVVLLYSQRQHKAPFVQRA
ncbi:hypothetical protein TgHK011_001361 [Trichoderma gracile]|nr:hypothetical protein TgHK011_001361 [Trichoderma gracile]